MAPTRTWRLAAAHSHLYPGAPLRGAAGEAPRGRWRTGDRLLLEFSDGVAAGGEVLGTEGDAIQLLVHAYRTAKGTPIAAKRWLAQWDGNALRIKTRIGA